jgi:hypothetical protein
MRLNGWAADRPMTRMLSRAVTVIFLFTDIEG